MPACSGRGDGLRKEKAHLNKLLSPELTSTAGSQGQGEGRGSSLSIHSLPSGPSSPFSTEEQPVASWALSFERLLQDPLGLAYFTVSPGWAALGKGTAEAGPGAYRASGWPLSMVPHLARLWYPFPHHQAGNSSFSLSLSLLLIFSCCPRPVPSVCLSGPSAVSVPVLEHVIQPVSEGFPSPLLTPGVPEEGIQRRERNFLESL